MHLNCPQKNDYLKITLISLLLVIVSRETILAQPSAFTGTTTDITVRERFIDKLLQKMTIEEKLGQLVQYNWPGNKELEKKRQQRRELIREGMIGSFLGVQGVELTGELQRLAVDESRLGIPLLFAADVIHGWRTIFPVPLAEASSWNPEAAERSARIAAIEATAQGLHWTFAPMVDIARDPRWGRIVEGSGEDPYLGSVMAAARVRGFQGIDISDPFTLLACAKHFCAYGAAEGGRDYNTVDISERTLRDIYLPPFHAAVKAGVETFMGAFNEINGVPMHANEYLINDVLRGEWGFAGLLISDFTAVMELLYHGVAADSTEAGILALNAGIDVDMMSGIYGKDLPKLVRLGKLSEDTVDKATRRVLVLKYKLGLFDDPYLYHDPKREKEKILTPEHRLAAREIARESIVLLKNDHQILPLSGDIKNLAVIGALAGDNDAPLGSWRGKGNPENVVTLLDGIKKSVTKVTKINYVPAYDLKNFSDTSGFDDAVLIARNADVVILALGERANMSGEANNRSSIDLPGAQQELAKKIYATGKPVVVILMNGRPLAIPWLADNVPTILETWFLGIEMGNAVADVLFGDYNPSGKLPATFPRATGQIPIYYNHKNTGRPPAEDNHYSSKYLDLPWTPQFPFGFGLSYTKFEYSSLILDAQEMDKQGKLKVAVAVKNCGSFPGDEVVQLYIQDVVASVTRPVKQLRGFKKIHLDPMEEKVVNFELSSDDLAFYNLEMKKTVEPGLFRIFVGGNSQDVLESEFKVVK